MSTTADIKISESVARYVAAEIADSRLAAEIARPDVYQLTASEADQVLEAATVCRTLITDHQHGELSARYPVPAEYNRRRASLLFALGRLIENIETAFVDDQQVNRHRGHCWRCPACDAQVTLFLPSIGAPTCSNHLQGGRLMVADN